MKYPVNIELYGKHCLVAGGGTVAYRKILPLLECGAKVTVVAEKINIDIRNIQNVNIELFEKKLDNEDLKKYDYLLIIAATNDSEVNKEVYEYSIKNNILVNVVDKPGLCTFFVPSVTKKGKLQVTISTDGVCPALSKYLRKYFEKILPNNMGDIVEEIAEYRKEVIKQDIDEETKRNLINDRIKKMLEF